MEAVCRLRLTIYPTENRGDPIGRSPGSLAPARRPKVFFNNLNQKSTWLGQGGLTMACRDQVLASRTPPRRYRVVRGEG
jgi:hypothetical protein